MAAGPSNPLAYFLTWTIHGSWLHGDDRGSVDREHNVVGTPLVKPDRVRAAWESRIARPGVEPFGPEARRIVEGSIESHCRLRAWPLLAVNARTNHVHAVVGFARVAPEVVLAQLKAWCTRRLREAGAVEPGQRVWTHHGSTKWLWEPDSVARAVDYVLNRQG